MPSARWYGWYYVRLPRERAGHSLFHRSSHHEEALRRIEEKTDARPTQATLPLRVLNSDASKATIAALVG